MSSLVITRIFDAPVEKVWAAWTEEDKFAKWWGPKDFTAPHVSIDFRVGGTYLCAMHGPAGTEFDVDMWNTGTFKEIVPLKKIVYADSFSDAQGNIVSPEAYGMKSMPVERLIVIEFEATADGKTQLTLSTDGPDASSEDAKNMAIGWNQSLDKLAESLQ